MMARILVADDNSDIRALLRDHLQAKHHEIIEATDGAQAFALAEEKVPHLIIMDIVMPGLYGTSASKRLQGYWRTSKIPIIIISGSIDLSLRGQLPDTPMLRFLRKPIDLAQLDRAIEELLPRGGYIP